MCTVAIRTSVFRAKYSLGVSTPAFLRECVTHHPQIVKPGENVDMQYASGYSTNKRSVHEKIAQTSSVSLLIYRNLSLVEQKRKLTSDRTVCDIVLRSFLSASVSRHVDLIAAALRWIVTRWSKWS